MCFKLCKLHMYLVSFIISETRLIQSVNLILIYRYLKWYRKNLEYFFVDYFCTVITFFYYIFQHQLHKNDTLYVVHERNSNVRHSAAYAITRKRNERTFHGSLAHALVFLFHSKQKSLHSVYNRLVENDYASLALNARYRLVSSSPFTKDIVYARDNTNM